ncbi:GrpB family protein [Isoptericola sp. NPDC057391]|uniref:GrpB family protein n=1 Tax=Isoptericola sp. NPDC057391 TaxID=3346117 RepID=UPI00362E41EE
MISVVDYHPGWPARFEELRAAYARALDEARAPYLSVEHVGSTAVPGLAAKPVIDVDVVVAEPDVEAASAALAGLGFVPRGDLGIAGRYAFDTPERFAPSHTYVAVAGSLALRNHLAVRDVLRNDPALRDEYGAVKRRAAAVAADIDEYLLLKSEVLGRVLRRAGLSEEERRAIAGTNRGIARRGARG